MWLSDTTRAILQSLKGGPLDPYQIAASVAQPHYRVRSELQTMKTGRLVLMSLGRDRVLWVLTDRGRRIAAADDQQRLGI